MDCDNHTSFVVLGESHCQGFNRQGPLLSQASVSPPLLQDEVLHTVIFSPPDFSQSQLSRVRPMLAAHDGFDFAFGRANF
jgi:hypothetical protein